MPNKILVPILDTCVNPLNFNKNKKKENKKVHHGFFHTLMSRNTSKAIEANAIGSINYKNQTAVPVISTGFRTIDSELVKKFDSAIERINKTEETAQEIQQYCAYIKAKAEIIYKNPDIKRSLNEVLNLYLKGKETSFEPQYDDAGHEILTYEYRPNSQFKPETVKIKETYGNGETKRESYFLGKMTKIVEYDDNKFSEAILNEDNLFKYSTGVIIDGEPFIKEEYHFNSPESKNILTRYSCDIEKGPLDTTYVRQCFKFNELGECTKYQEGLTRSAENCDIKSDAEYGFRNGKFKSAKFQFDRTRGIIGEFIINKKDGYGCEYFKNFRNYYSFDAESPETMLDCDGTEIGERYGFSRPARYRLTPDFYIEGYVSENGKIVSSKESYFGEAPQKAGSAALVLG